MPFVITSEQYNAEQTQSVAASWRKAGQWTLAWKKKWMKVNQPEEKLLSIFI